jgi:hypothetical protein
MDVPQSQSGRIAGMKNILLPSRIRAPDYPARFLVVILAPLIEIVASELLQIMKAVMDK